MSLWRVCHWFALWWLGRYLVISIFLPMLEHFRTFPEWTAVTLKFLRRSVMGDMVESRQNQSWQPYIFTPFCTYIISMYAYTFQWSRIAFFLALSFSLYICIIYWLLWIVSFACSSIHMCDYSLFLCLDIFINPHLYQSSSFQTRSLHLQGPFKSWEAWLCCRGQRRSRHPMARGMQAAKGWCNCCKGTGFSQLRLKWDSLRGSKGGHIFRMSLKDEGQRLVAWFAKWWISNNVNASTSLVSCRLSEHFSTLLFSRLLCTDRFSDWDY